MKDLSIISKKELDNLIDKSNILLKISSRAVDSKYLGELKIFDNTRLELIANNMPEINRASNSFGRTNSQFIDKLMSLTMISYSPYRYLHQCLSKIESRRQALSQHQFKLKRELLEIEKINNKLSDDPDNKELLLDLEEKIVNIQDSILYIEGALKEILVYQDAYNEIKSSNNIPDNWDELDFERSEIKHHIKMAFLNGIKDIISSNKLNHGTVEYLIQLGINPILANVLISSYVTNTLNIISEKQYPNIKHLDEFLEQMYNTFSESYKDQLSIIGLKKLITEEALFLDNNLCHTLDT